jgi:hypothetical protein
MLTRNANDRKAVEELTSALRKLNPEDPVIYDFALFGIGILKICRCGDLKMWRFEDVEI